MARARQSVASKPTISAKQTSRQFKKLKLISLSLILICLSSIESKQPTQIPAWLFDDNNNNNDNQNYEETPLAIEHNEHHYTNNNNNKNQNLENEEQLQDSLRLLERQVDDSSRQSRALDQLMAPYNPFTFNGQQGGGANTAIKPIAQQNGNPNQGQQQRDLNQYKTVYACEGNKLELSCANEGKLIHLVRATYGRFSLSMCNEHGHSNLSVQCVQFRAFLIMQPICNGSANCSVIASKELFGDPCEGTPKYLEVQYYCDEAQQQHNNGSIATNATSNNSNRHLQIPSKSQASGEHQQQANGNANNGATPTSQTSQTNHHLPHPTHTNSPHLATQPILHTNTSPSRTASAVAASAGLNGPACASQLSVRSLSWNATRAGQFARQACPEGSSGHALWLCDARKLAFTPHSGPDFSQCRTIWLAKLASQLEQTQSSFSNNNANNNHHLESMLRLQAPAYLSLLADLRLLAQARQLFGEDLKIINVMLGQMATSIKQAVATATIHPNYSGSSLAASQFERLFQRLLELTSSLFEPMQRLAWLELSSSGEIRSLEAHLLNHLRLFGSLMGASLINNPYSSLASQGGSASAAAELSWREKNLQARLVTLSSASLLQQQQQLAVIQQTNSINQDQLVIDQQNYVRIGEARDEQLAAPSDSALEFTELKLHSGVLRQLAHSLAGDSSNFNGASRILVIDVRKADFGLLKQQQQVSDQVPAELIASSANPSSQAASASVEPQQRIIGVFPILGSPGDQLAAAAATATSGKLNELLAQWPLSVQFKISPAQQQQSICSSSLSSEHHQPIDEFQAAAAAAAGNSLLQEKCQTIRSSSMIDPFNLPAAATIVCRCEQLGFVTVSSSSPSSELPIGAQDQDAASSVIGFRQANNYPRSQNNNWQRPGLQDDQSIAADNSYVFGSQSGQPQPISGDATTIISSQQQPKSISSSSSPSQTLFSGMTFGLGIALLLLALVGLFLGLSRMSFQSRLLASKQATYLGSGSTTDPQLEHSLVASCCPIVTSNANTMHQQQHHHSTPTTTTTAPAISPYQFHYHSAQASPLHQSHLLSHKDLSTLNTRHHHQQRELNYGLPINGATGLSSALSMRGQASRWVPSWLQKPTSWFKLNRQRLQHQPHHTSHLGQNHNHYDQHISPLHSNIIQHQQATLPQVLHQQHRSNLINVGHYGTNKAHHFGHQNGYATNHLNQHQQHNPQLIAALNAGAPGSSNSTSSYVSSSAYYEEIGQPGSGGSSSNGNGNLKHHQQHHGATPTTTTSSSTSQLIPSHPTHHQRTIVDPFKGPNNIIITSNLNHNQNNHNNYL